MYPPPLLCNGSWECKDQRQCLLSFFLSERSKVGGSNSLRVMRLRQIWSEGTFAVLKREHKLNGIAFESKRKNASYLQRH